MIRVFNLLLCLLLFFFISCNPDEDDILGLDLIQDDEFLIEKYTFSSNTTDLNIKNFQEEDVSGSGSYNLLGSFYDDFFGQSDASFYFQVLLPSNNVDFEASETNPNVKLELSLPFYGIYGDTTQNQFVSVYEVTQSLSAVDTTMVTSTELYQYDNNPLTQSDIQVNLLSDSVQWNNETVSPRLIIDLSASNLVTKILEASSFDLENNENFNNLINGLYLKVNSLTNGSIIYFDTNSPQCFLRMSYIKNDNTEAIVDFPIGTDSNTHNYFTHDYSNSEALNFITNQSIDSLIFLQSMGGLAMELDLSFLSNDIYSDWVISQASLNIPVYKDVDYSKYPAPSYLVLTEFEDSSDVAIQGITGGLFNPVAEEYNFNISSHVQKIISNNHNGVLRLYVGGKNSNAERLIIDNRVGTGMNLDLHIIK
ncbi:DUF4270 domain-containing protein [Bacteroidota bacterium]|nr:DUF4270 domain-containing protein [Bacteroidota bacterium]